MAVRVSLRRYRASRSRAFLSAGMRRADFASGAGQQTGAVRNHRRARQRSVRRGLIGDAGSLNLGNFKGVTSRLLPRLLHGSNFNGLIWDEVLALAKSIGAAVFRREQRAVQLRPASRELLHSIGMPTIIVVGEADELMPVGVVQEMRRGIGGSVLHVFECCGH